MTDKRYSKVEEEIIQILNQMDDEARPEPPTNLVPFRPRPKPKRFDVSRLRPGTPGILQRVRRYSAGSWVGVGIVAALLAWQTAGLFRPLAIVAMFISLAAFMAALYTRKAGSVSGMPSSSTTTKRWRGRDIDLSEPRSMSSFARDRNWIKRFRGPRR